MEKNSYISNIRDESWLRVKIYEIIFAAKQNAVDSYHETLCRKRHYVTEVFLIFSGEIYLYIFSLAIFGYM